MAGSGTLLSVSMLDSWIVAVGGGEPPPSLHGRLERGVWLYPPFQLLHVKKAQKPLSVQELQLSFSLAVLLNQDC